MVRTKNTIRRSKNYRFQGKSVANRDRRDKGKATKIPVTGLSECDSSDNDNDFMDDVQFAAHLAARRRQSSHDHRSCQQVVQSDGSDSSPERPAMHARRYMERKKKGTFNTRSTTSPLFNTIYFMTDKQKEDVRAMGFGSVLHVQIKTIPPEAAQWLANAMCTSTMALILGSNKEIRVQAEDVECTLGLPRGPRQIEVRTHVPATPALLKWRKQFRNGNFKVGVSELCAEIGEQMNGGELFKQNFLVLVSTVLVYYGTTTYCNQSLFQAIENVDEAKEFDWCTPVLDGLIKAKRKWSTGCCFGGSLPFLLYFYLDRVEYQLQTVPRVNPSLVGWTEKIVKARIAEEVRNSHFGAGRIRETRPEVLYVEDVPCQTDADDIITDHHVVENSDDDETPSRIISKRMKRMRGLYDDILRISGEFREMYHDMRDTLGDDPKVVHLVLCDDKPLPKEQTSSVIPYYEDPRNLVMIDHIIEVNNKGVEKTSLSRSSDRPSFSLGITQLDEEFDAAEILQEMTTRDRQQIPPHDSMNLFRRLSTVDSHGSEHHMSMEEVASIGKSVCGGLSHVGDIRTQGGADQIESNSPRVDSFRTPPNELSNAFRRVSSPQGDGSAIHDFAANDTSNASVGNLFTAPLAPIDPEDNIANRVGKRVPAGSVVLLSPLNNRRTDFTSDLLLHEHQLYDWFMNKRMNKSDDSRLIVSYGDDDSIDSKRGRSLMHGSVVEPEVVSMWTRFLNYMEARRDPNGPYRVFLGPNPSIILGHDPFNALEFDQAIATEIAKCGGKIEDADLITIAMKGHSHIWVMCFDAARAEIILFDSIFTPPRTGTYIDDPTPITMRDHLLEHIGPISQRLYDIFKNVRPHRLRVPWETTDNIIDCGVLAMFAMESYVGQRQWSGRLPPEGLTLMKMITTLRVRFFVRMVMWEKNSVREAIIQRAKGYYRRRKPAIQFDIDYEHYN